jgi:cyclohexanecarboxyl-CoA dehydrogenase
MLDFSFSEDQEMLRRAVRDFARKEIAPGIKERIEEGVFPRELVKSMAELGLLGMSIPAEYGGQPADWVSIGIMIEELAKVDFCASCIPFLAAPSPFLLQLASPEVQKEWLPLLASGDKIFVMGATEPDCGSDLAAVKTKVVRTEDGYVISGEKTSITYGMQADVMITLAKFSPETKRVTPFIVPLDSPGVVRSAISDMGWEPIGRASIILDEVKVPHEYCLGEEDKGLYKVLPSLGVARVLAALQALALAEAALEDAIAYAKQRIAFGRPIAEFQGVSHKLAEAATQIEMGKWFCYRVLWMQDQGIPHGKESAMCKWWCPEAASQIIHNALVIHGHVGYSKEYHLEQRLRDALGLEIGDGPSNIMKMIISRDILS